MVNHERDPGWTRPNGNALETVDRLTTPTDTPEDTPATPAPPAPRQNQSGRVTRLLPALRRLTTSQFSPSRLPAGTSVGLATLVIFALSTLFDRVNYEHIPFRAALIALACIVTLIFCLRRYRVAAPMTLAVGLAAGIDLRLRAEPYQGSDTLLVTRAGIDVMTSGGNPYSQFYDVAIPPSTYFPYFIGEPAFYWIHLQLSGDIVHADLWSGMLIMLLFATLVPVVGWFRSSAAVTLYAVSGRTLTLAAGQSNDNSMMLLLATAVVLLIYSEARPTPDRWRRPLLVLAALFMGWALLFKIFTWFFFPFIVLALRQRGGPWLWFGGVAVGLFTVAMAPYAIDDFSGVMNSLTLAGVPRDVWGFNVWTVLRTYFPDVVATMEPWIGRIQYPVTAILGLWLLLRRRDDLGSAVLAGLAVCFSIVFLAKWSTSAYYGGFLTMLILGFVTWEAPALKLSPGRQGSLPRSVIPGFGWLARRLGTDPSPETVAPARIGLRKIRVRPRTKRSTGQGVSIWEMSRRQSVADGGLTPIGFGTRAATSPSAVGGQLTLPDFRAAHLRPANDHAAARLTDPLDRIGPGCSSTHRPNRSNRTIPSTDDTPAEGPAPERWQDIDTDKGFGQGLDDPASPSPAGRSPSRPVLAPRTTWPWRRRLALRTTFPGLLVLIAVCVAAPLRLIGLGDIPSGLNQDEAVSGYDAWSIFRTGRDHHGHPVSLTGLESFGDWASPFLTLLTVPVVGVLGLSVESIRLVSALLGIAAVVVGYFLGRELTGSRAIGVGTAWTLALLPVAIHLSRWAIPPTTVPLLVVATLLALVWALRRQSASGLIVAAAVAGLATSGYPALKVYIPLLVVATVLIFWRNTLAILREAPGRFLVALGVGGIIAGPILWLGSRDPGGRARAEQVSALNDPSFGPAQVVDAYRSYFSPDFLFLSGDGDAMHLPSGYGALPLFLLPPLVAGLIALLSRVFAPQVPGDRERSLVLLAATVLIPLPGALTVPSPHLLRSAQLIPLSAILSAIGLVAFGRLLWQATGAGRRTGSRLGFGLLVIAGLLVAGVQLNDQYQNYFGAWPDRTATAFQSGGLEAAQYAYDHRLEYDTVYVSGMNQGYIYPLFAGPWDPGAVHEELAVDRNPPAFNTVTGIDNVQFSDPPEQLLRQGGETMFQIDRDGEPLFAAIAYTGPTGDQVLVVRPV